MSTQPTDLDDLMARIDNLVEHAREDDRLCYDQTPSQRYADAREDMRAVLAKWGSPVVAGEPHDLGPWQVDHWKTGDEIVLQSHHFEHDVAVDRSRKSS